MATFAIWGDLSGEYHHYTAYDANGNLTHATVNGTTRNVAWTSFNKPQSISKGDASSTFGYTPSRMRYRQTDTAPEAQPDGSAILRTTDTLYFGAYERVADSDKVVHRYSVTADGQSIAVRELETRAETPAVLSKQRTHYLHRDHLGSVLLITDALGRKLERAAYGVWGQRIDLNGLVTDTTFNPAAGAGSAFTHAATANYHRGFTGHDTLEHLGLINMQGRIYDPEIGRFLSADPFVQFPESTQGFNRYTYVGNNPLSYTDPSGYFSLKKELGRALGHVAGYLSFIPGCQIWCSAIAGAVSGYLLTGSLQGAVIGAAGGALSAITTNGGNLFGLDFAQRFAIGSVGSGILTKAGGGRFGDGFLSGSLGSIAGGLSGGNPIIAAVLGGTVAEIGGGNFASGAKSAFFHALFGGQIKAMFSGMGGGRQQHQTQDQQQQKAVTVDATTNSHATGFWGGVRSVVGKLWTLPNTIAGLIYGGIGHVVGLIKGTNPSISFGNNGIQFENNPFIRGGEALSLGNAMLYGEGASPGKYGVYGDISVNYGRHEGAHTHQYELLGPLYAPFYIFSGGFAGPSGNFLEQGAQDYGAGRGDWW